MSPGTCSPSTGDGQPADPHAVVAHPLDVRVRLQHAEHDPEVRRDRRLPRDQRLDVALDLAVQAVDAVVDGGQVVEHARLPVLQRHQRAVDGLDGGGAGLLQRALEGGELGVEFRPHPNRPVT